MSANGLSATLVVRWALQLCDLLAWCHNRPTPFVCAALSPETLVLGDNERIKLVDLGLASLLRASPSPELRAPAPGSLLDDFVRLGETLSFLLGSSLTAPPQPAKGNSLRTGLAAVVQKCLEARNSRTAPSFETLKADLEELLRVDDTPATRREAREAGRPSSVLDSLVSWAALHPGKAFVAVVLAAMSLGLAAFLLPLGGASRVTLLSGAKPWFLAVEAGKAVEVISVPERRVLGSFPLGGEATALYQGSLPGKAYLAVPSQQRIVVFNLVERLLESRTLSHAQLQRLIPTAGNDFVLGTGNTQEITSIDLKRMKACGTISLPAAPVDLAYVPIQNAVASLSNNPPGLQLTVVDSGRTLATTKLSRGATRMRLDPEGSLLWLLPDAAGSPLTLVEARTLRETAKIDLGKHRAVDVAFTLDSALVLLEGGGGVALVDRATRQVTRTLPGDLDARSIFVAQPGEYWLAGTSTQVSVVNIATGSVEHLTLADSPVSGLIAR